jgi:hypothetical protein
MSDVTQLLSALEQGQAQASEELLPLVHDELRRLAAWHLANEQPGQTLQATALVHKAHLRLVGKDDRPTLQALNSFTSTAANRPTNNWSADHCAAGRGTTFAWAMWRQFFRLTPGGAMVIKTCFA